ncbi:hypothetical protein [Arthrobacter sp. StoSoilB13]|nr:hypothetical protein [Arthrobacter sp. StoSoilB13]
MELEGDVPVKVVQLWFVDVLSELAVQAQDPPAGRTVLPFAGSLRG